MHVFAVTGGAGFVGSHLIRALLKAFPDAQIVSVDIYLPGTPGIRIEDPRVTHLDVSTVDINEEWDKAGLPSPTAVFHLGEYARIVQSFDELDLCWELNLHGTKEVVRFCDRHGARLVYAGSSSKFGNDGQDENLSPYAWTKAKNVEYIKNFANWYGLDYVITYFYNVYGPGHIKDGKYATVIGIFESQYERGEPLSVVAPGTQTRDFTHVDDIIDGILACYRDGSGDGYLLGYGHEWPLAEVAGMFTDNYTLVPARQGERVRGQADTTKARSLGWAPKRRLPDYIAAFKADVEARKATGDDASGASEV
ncbi:NAD-dependent epimerase/dehydratase family protein [Micromonospora coerulea]|uniref:NAD-dependent epimerase/dehydratase family protein n=1 Tax=Micromonospora coerulea TaxID=47856 RepID=UPI001902EFA7|nr:NAD-dependent epimerase/dehydratase family protein [Micromonospora veneta]